MKKSFFFIVFLYFISITFLYSKELTIYTYDSFNSEWGPGPKVFPLFEKKCHCVIKIVALGDSGAMLNKLILEKDNPRADIVIGLNDSQVPLAANSDIFLPVQNTKYSNLPAELKIDPHQRFIPFDYGHLAFIYDSTIIKEPPRSLNELLDKKYKKKIVIENPLTSSPGLSFLHWTIQAFGEEHYLEYWRKLSSNLLTVTSSWATAYGMFTQGEVPIVLSYVTSPAYHYEYEQSQRYKAAIFTDGHYRQIEYSAIMKETQNLKLAQLFIDFTLGEDFQNIIPTTNWMFPVIEYKPLPASFHIIKKPKIVPQLHIETIKKKNTQWLNEWSRNIGF